MLLREIQPTQGRIIVNGTDITRLKNRKIALYRRQIGTVFQDFRLLKDRNVYENVAFAQRVIEVPNRNIKKNVPVMLSLVGLAGKYKSKIKELSGGEQQRVAIARAIIAKPELIFADEPTGNLDKKTGDETIELLFSCAKKLGQTLIIVTHDLELAKKADRIIQIEDGKVI